MTDLKDYEAAMISHMAHCACEGDLWKHDERLTAPVKGPIGTVIHWPRLRIVTDQYT